SVPVSKLRWDGKLVISPPGGDDTPFVYAGSLVVQGQGLARVLRTGLHTEMGGIGKAVQGLTLEDSPLQRETRRIVRVVFFISLVLCTTVTMLYVVLRGGWLDGLLAGIVLAMAILPAEFPVVLTVFLALGAWRIAKARVLTRHLPAIETLGAATLLCVDKTGTLTQNRMVVSKLMANGTLFDVSENSTELPEPFHSLLEYTVLASETAPFDPMERAIHEAAKNFLAHSEHLHPDWELVHEYSLSPELLAMSHLWQAPHGEHTIVATKGAPEAIADLCHLDAAQLHALMAQVGRLADEGLRVLGVAKALHREGSPPAHQHAFDFEFLGLVALLDPLRAGVKQAVAECHAAGIRVVMITGDYPRTASAVARQLGFGEAAALSGTELDALSDSALQDRIGSVNVFARIAPAQKLRLIQAFKARGEIVAMTGDGVNDAPALKAAHIGVAMGGRGTDVAREAASLVLLDDDFPSIVRAVRLGRRIHDNLRRAMSYLFAVHVPIAGIALLPLLFGQPLLFAPIHVLFLELIIDPACSLAFEAEPEEKDVMRRPPRDPREPMFLLRAILLNLLQGLGSLVAVMAVYSGTLYYGFTVESARTMAFAVLVISNLGLILSNRARGTTGAPQAPNSALWWVVGGALAGLILVIYAPSVSALFSFSALSISQLLMAFAAGAGCMLWYELLKSISASRRAGHA
ncbi:MAG TPA: cation-translocating P-type ATPase, partial [Gammaproteobacteria bacterium]|nr:cation-translocating P-type ATPase [Gammaproteobacteria bacterium]